MSVPEAVCPTAALASRSLTSQPSSPLPLQFLNILLHVVIFCPKQNNEGLIFTCTPGVQLILHPFPLPPSLLEQAFLLLLFLRHFCGLMILESYFADHQSVEERGRLLEESSQLTLLG